MSEWEHTVVLSDGTKLTQAQWDALIATGEVTVDGRRFTKSEKERRREAAFAADMLGSFREKL